MTNEEAIAIIRQEYLCVDRNCDIERSCGKCDLAMPSKEPILEAYKMAIKALEQEPCDCISRAELLKAVDTWDKFGCDADTKLVPYKDCYVPYIHYDNVVKAIKGMPSIQPTVKKNLVVGDCISREFIEIVVNYPPADLCTYPEYRGKPYFSIKYRENGNGYVGFGTYKIEILSQWIKEYFMPSIQPKPIEGDAISRKEALDLVEDMTDQFGVEHRVVTEGMISLLPSVTPKPKTDVLGKIRAEIEQKARPNEIGGRGNGKSIRYGLYMALQIIDKYKAESEDKE